MLPIHKVAMRFAEKTGFTITQGSVHDDAQQAHAFANGRIDDVPHNQISGGFFELANHTHGVPRVAGQPAITLQVVQQMPDPVIRADLCLLHRGMGEMHVVSAHSDGTLTINVNKLPRDEFDVMLTHAKTLHDLMQSNE